MDTTYNVTRSKQLRLGIQKRLGSNSRGARSTCRVELLQLTPPSAASLIRRIL